MGRLIDPEKRDRAKRQRTERKQKILLVARSTFSRLPYVEVTLDSIGQAADVDRGMASMYFGSKEGLFLLLLREELAEWYAKLIEEFDGTDGQLTTQDLAGLLAGSLSERPELTRFLSVETVVLEQNLDAMEAFRFQKWRRDKMVEVGELIDRSVAGLKGGEGIRLLHRVQLLTAVLRPASDPRGAALYEVGDPDFEVFKIDFESELTSILAAILNAQFKSEE